MLNELFTIKRPTTDDIDSTSIVEYEDLRDVRITWTPDRDNDSSIGGGVPTTSRSCEWTSTDTSADIQDGDILQNETNTLRIANVYRYESDYPILSGTGTIVR